jgi:hypothetical protein
MALLKSPVLWIAVALVTLMITASLYVSLP